jgi:hypothetical protein
MWRTYVICVLIGLLLVSTGSNVLLLRQVLATQADADRLRSRLTAAEGTQNSLQQQLDQLVAAPTALIAGPDRGLLQRIQAEVAGLRGLQPRADVPLQMLDNAALQRYLVERFNTDYLPSERESDQKLLLTLGLIGQYESVTQTLLDILQEQVIGVYGEDEKMMYIVADRASFGPEEKTTFAHEYTHALQDQHFDLRKLMPKHPTNDDRSLALQALIEGDAVLMQRLWAQQNLSQSEINQLGQGGGDSRLFSAPVFIREQLLFAYADGFNFVRQLYQARGGYPGVDEVFRDPPESTEQILHVEKYRTRDKPIEVDLPDLADGRLGPGWRKINSNVLGELDLRLILEQHTDRARAVRAASGWGGDRWLLLEKDGRQALVIKSVWDGETEARSFFEAFGLGLRNRFSDARSDVDSPSRQALTAAQAATELRREGATVVVVISFDRQSAELLAAAV